MSQSLRLTPLLTFLLGALQLISISALHEVPSFVLEPATRQCFYEDFTKTTPVQVIEVFVEEGGSLDVALTVHGPLTLLDAQNEAFEDPTFSDVVTPDKMSDGETSTYMVELKPYDDGLYAICVDNRAATFLSRRVQVDIREARRPEPIALHLGGEGSSGNLETQEEQAVSNVMEALERIRKGIKNIQIQQQVDRHRLQLHSMTNKMANNRVIISSIVETVFFVAAALFQIFYVRRWFASRNSKVGVLSYYCSPSFLD
jgi:hypothetical protein